MVNHHIGNLSIEVPESITLNRLQLIVLSCWNELFDDTEVARFVYYLVSGKASTQPNRDACERQLREILSSVVFEECVKENKEYDEVMRSVLRNTADGQLLREPIEWIKSLPISTHYRRVLSRVALKENSGSIGQGMPYLLRLWKENSLSELTGYSTIGEKCVSELDLVFWHYLGSSD